MVLVVEKRSFKTRETGNHPSERGKIPPLGLGSRRDNSGCWLAGVLTSSLLRDFERSYGNLDCYIKLIGEQLLSESRAWLCW